MAKKVLEQDLFAHAERPRERFRTFLVTSLENFVISEMRQERALKRSPEDRTVPIDEHIDDAKTAVEPSDACCLAWAQQLLATTLERMQDQCRQRPIWLKLERAGH